MTNNNDPLNQLWQQQSVEQADILAISKQWKQVQLKQRLYAVVDLFSLFIPFIILYIFWGEIDSFSKKLVLAVMFLSVPVVLYIIWLRRFSLGWSSLDTEQHIQKLRKQIVNNIKIAFITKHSVWPSLLIPVVHFSGLYYFDVYTVDRLLYKGGFSMGIVVLTLPYLWIWANKRQKRFSKELANLNLLFGSHSS